MSRDSWWVEYLENEVDPSLKQDMEKLLEKSGRDRGSVETLAALRQWVAESDPAEELWREDKIKPLQGKILAAIAKLPVAPKAQPRKRAARTPVVESSLELSNKRPRL